MEQQLDRRRLVGMLALGVGWPWGPPPYGPPPFGQPPYPLAFAAPPLPGYPRFVRPLPPESQG